MNLWVKRAGLIIGLALLIFACEDSSQIGLELDPGKGNFVAKYVELPLKASVVQVDSVPTNNSGRIMVGNLNDPEFGTVKAVGYSRIFMNGTGLEIADGASYDSLVLSIDLNYFYGVDKNTVQHIAFHELKEDILDTTYYTWDTTAFDPEVIGEGQFDLSYVDTTRIDTTYSIKMSDTFGQKLFQEARTDTATFLHSDNERFIDTFKGLAITAGEPNTSILGLSPTSSNTRLVMYYHTSTDTLAYRFNLLDYNYGYSNDLTLYYNHVIIDKSGTPLSGLNEFYKEYDPGDDMSYVQSGTGILTRISLQPVLDFVDTAGNVILNRAEIEVRSDEYQDYLEPPRYLELSVSNNNNFIFYNGSRLAVQSEEGSGNLQMLFSRGSDFNEGFYNGNITKFTQYIIDGTSSDTVLLVTPSSFISSLDRMVSKNADVKLKLYYSSSK